MRVSSMEQSVNTCPRENAMILQQMGMGADEMFDGALDEPPCSYDKSDFAVGLEKNIFLQIFKKIFGI
jgi:hypothetical protein